MTPDLETDILIIGAGPTGLTLGAELRNLGLAPLIFDKALEPEKTSRAAIIHAHTLEVLAPIGVTAMLLERGVRVETLRIRDADKILMSVDFQSIPSDYNFALACPQNETEALLATRLQQLGGTISRGFETSSFAFDDTGATVTLTGQDGRATTVRTKWLIGCDGSHSAVSAAAQIVSEGSSYALNFVLADIDMTWAIQRDEMDVFFSPDGLLIIVPLPNDRYRMIATVEEAPQTPSLELIARLVAERGPQHPRGNVTNINWSSRFRTRHSIVESPRKGRVLLCGDAAHLHSPAGGQGMNTGIQDAVALASAIKSVIAGASDTVLDDWAAERHKIAEGVITLTDRMTKMATLKAPGARELRNVALSVAGHLPFLTNWIARTVAELPEPTHGAG